MRISDWSSDVCSSDLAQLRRVGELRTARFCYDHLAGRLGVALADSLLQRRLLRRQDGDFRVGPKGRAFLEDLGIDIAAAQGERRHFARCCLDWSERRRSEEHTSELQSLMRISYAVFCLKKKKNTNKQ